MALQTGMFNSTSIEETIDGYPKGKKAVDAAFFAHYNQGLTGNGVTTSPTSSFLVIADAGLTYQRRAGSIYINGYHAYDQQSKTFTLTQSESARTLYHVFRLDLPAETITEIAVETLTRNDSVYDLAVAKLVIPANANAIHDSMITDLRGDPSYCGYVQKMSDETAESILGELHQAVNNMWQVIYPVNSIYISYSHVSPAELFGGSWVRITSFLYGCSDADTIGQTGGEETHTLTINEMPSHKHEFNVWDNVANSQGSKAAATHAGATIIGTIDTTIDGKGNAHNNLPPYTKVSIWRRTA